MKETLRAEAVRLGLTLTDAQLMQMYRFADALLEKNTVMNLTAITEPQAVARLHFADSLALLRAADLRHKDVIDVGCGAGFPGVALKLGEPSLRLTLLDSLQKRVHWLSETLASLGVDARCVCARAEEFPEWERFDIAVSRAVARLNILCELCLPLVRIGGLFLAMKAASADEELAEAQRALRLLGGRLESVYDYTVDGAPRRILCIRKYAPTPASYPRRFAKIRQQPL